MPWFGHSCLYNLSQMLLSIILHLCCFKKKNLRPLIWLGRAAAATPFLTHGDLLRVNIGLLIGFRLLFSRPAVLLWRYVSETYFCMYVCNKLHCCSLCLKPTAYSLSRKLSMGMFQMDPYFLAFLALWHSCRAVSLWVTCLQQGELPLGFLSCSFPTKTFSNFHWSQNCLYSAFIFWWLLSLGIEFGVDQAFYFLFSLSALSGVIPVSSYQHYFWWKFKSHSYHCSTVCDGSFSLAALKIFSLSLLFSSMTVMFLDLLFFVLSCS